MAERRQHERFELERPAFASLSYRFTVLGKIFNINVHGLAFSYVASEQRSHECPFLDIVFTNDRQRLRKVPFQTVWDKPMFQEFNAGTISIRHCGVKFDGLTKSQQAEIDSLIQNGGVASENAL